MTTPVERLAEACLNWQHRIVTAESCTGGMIAAVLTSVPGSSDWFERGYVTYTNEAKHDCLGVPPLLIETHGAVSEQVVRMMSVGALKASNADIAVSVSGIAGPDGGSEEKPVGTVWFCCQGPEGIVARKAVFAGDRAAIRQQAVDFALDLLIAAAG